jgi:Na+-driven multidrug efflux pump
MAVSVMVLWSIACLLAGAAMVRVFSDDPQVVAIGDEYLHIVSWTFPASGVIFVASSMFQAMGNTLPALIGSLVRIVIVTIPAFLLSRLPGFALHWIWYLSVGAIAAQLAVNVLLLRREFERRLSQAALPAQPESGPTIAGVSGVT